MKKLVCILKYLLIINEVFNLVLANNVTVKLVSVVFRHGDRTPEPLGQYPRDPYIDFDYYPMGLGALTNNGKEREYRLGMFLRSQYNEHLGETYVPSDVYAQSTDTDRTKMSLLLVLAGLYQPKGEQIWLKGLSWQPIPITYAPKTEDHLLLPKNCPEYKKEALNVQNSSEFIRENSLYDELMKNLTIHTGRKIKDVRGISHLYHTLVAEDAMNLTLPEWTKYYFPNGLMKDAVLFRYRADNYSPILKKLYGGMVLRKILNEMKNVSEGNTRKVQKIFLYSAHESNLAAILLALNVWKPKIPEYSSAVIIELVEKNSEYYVKVMYYKGIPPEPETRVIPGCVELCPLKDFIRITKDVLPTDTLEGCYGLPTH